MHQSRNLVTRYIAKCLKLRFGILVSLPVLARAKNELLSDLQKSKCIRDRRTSPT
jgi:hypothetical protein